jgi:adenine-specific DNA-methyltransferase
MLPGIKTKANFSADGGGHAARPVGRAPAGSPDRDDGNLIIQGDNRAVLTALRARFAGQVRCAYIDPPYNNQERYNHYDDLQSHENWLADVVACAERIKPLLRDDGSLWVSIDDREVHYLKVALDGVFSRENFVTTIVWEQRTTRENRKAFSNNHEYILVYAANIRKFKENRGALDWSDDILARYKNPDNDPRGPWQSVSANVQAGHATQSQFYDLVAPNGKRHAPPNGRCWVYNQARMTEAIHNNNVWFGKDGNGAPRLKRFLNDARRGLTPHTLWPAAEVGTNDQAKKHLLSLFPDQAVFDTPKPESLIHQVLRIASAPGDLVLDAYLGSGTTAAVAHKMQRRYIGIEVGDHAATLCAERLRQVMAGEGGGVSPALGWTGGGAFAFYHLSPDGELAEATAAPDRD